MKKVKIFSLILLLPLIFSGCYGYVPIEELSITVGIGNDLNMEKHPYYSGTFERLIFQGNNKISNLTLTGKGDTIYTIQNQRQPKNTKKWGLASEVVYLFSEARAKDGIKDVIDAFIRDPRRNENSYIAVTKQPVNEVLSIKSPFAFSTSETLRGILEFASESNFFEPKNTLVNLLLMYTQQGRQIAVPYIEIKDNKPEITGLALFKGDKMLEKVSLEEAALINLMRTSKSQGYLSILSGNPPEYIDFLGKNLVRVKASKENERLKYDIFVTLNGNLTVNSLVEKDKSLINLDKVEEVFSKKLEEDLTKEIEKMQKEYKTDWLDLGQYAVAKLGRDTDYANDEHFCNAEINVHVDVKVASSGRKSDK